MYVVYYGWVGLKYIGKRVYNVIFIFVEGLELNWLF